MECILEPYMLIFLELSLKLILTRLSMIFSYEFYIIVFFSISLMLQYVTSQIALTLYIAIG